MIAVVIAVFVTAAWLTVAWAVSQIGKARSKNAYVRYFEKVTRKMLAAPSAEPEYRELLLALAPYIQSKKLADDVARRIARGEVSPKIEGQSPLIRLLNGDRENMRDVDGLLLAAIYYFLMALSYSSRRFGGDLRRKLRRDLASGRAIRRDGARAYQAAVMSEDRIAAA